MASDWPRTFFTARQFLFSIYIYNIYIYIIYIFIIYIYIYNIYIYIIYIYIYIISRLTIVSREAKRKPYATNE